MRSPYMWFVEKLADLIDGEHPRHFDTRVKRRVRFILFFSVISFASCWAFGPRDYLFSGFVPTTNEELLALLIFLVMPFLLSHASLIRRQSIEQHAIRSSFSQILSGSTDTDVVEDAVLLYDYIKVFFALFIMFTVLQLPYFFVPNQVTEFLSTISLPYHLYYMLIVMIGGFILGGRWAIQITNNNTSNTDTKSKQTE